MSSEIPAAAPNKKLVWIGRVISALPIAGLLFSAAIKLMGPEEVLKEFTRLGYTTPNIAMQLGIVELICAIIYLIPQTAVLGAILLTGYLGGAIATHVRLGEAFIGPAVMGVLIWLGIFLRDARLRQLLPWRR